MNQEFNFSIPSYMLAQQHQLKTSNHFPPINPSLDNFSSPKLLNLTGISNTASLACLGQQTQLPDSIRNNQSGSPWPETQMLCGGYVSELSGKDKADITTILGTVSLLSSLRPVERPTVISLFRPTVKHLLPDHLLRPQCLPSLSPRQLETSY